MVKDISSHFKQPNKKRAKFKRFQENRGNTSPLEVLFYSPNRLIDGFLLRKAWLES